MGHAGGPCSLSYLRMWRIAGILHVDPVSITEASMTTQPSAKLFADSAREGGANKRSTTKYQHQSFSLCACTYVCVCVCAFVVCVDKEIMLFFGASVLEIPPFISL
ncbi:Hypothetical predicted protein [Podarcis lilfordi]|uniref:Uncharacterized protein n=1 Tax=Podarcis lilfordi TaxID=74358 RepID=A0AA35K0C5_9SAUR|nr:Hypothetical predicted protein [Podarcis lilfordi]